MFSKLILALALVGLSTTAAQACPGGCDGKGPGQGRGQGAGPEGQAGPGYAMRHASAMPNLMRVVTYKADALKLTDAQQKTFAEWRGANHAKSMGLAKTIMDGEKALRDAARGDADTAALTAQFQAVAEARQALFQLKLNCRDTAKQTLSAEQWATLVKLDAEMKPPHRNRQGAGPGAQAKPCDGQGPGGKPCDCQGGKGKAAGAK